MKRLFIISIMVLVVAAGSLWGWKWYRQREMDIWSFVPSHATMVFQPYRFASLWMPSEERKIWNALQSFPAIDSLQHVFEKLDSATHGQLDRWFSPENGLVAFHQHASKTLAPLYIFRITPTQREGAAAVIRALVADSSAYATSENYYAGHAIRTLRGPSRALAYAFHHNFLLVSPMAVLVEDGLRRADEHQAHPYAQQARRLSQVRPDTASFGRFYIHTQPFSEFIHLVVNQNAVNTSRLPWFTQLMSLDLYVEDDKINLAGFSFNDTSEVNYLATFEHNESQGFEMKNIIPSSAPLVIHTSVEDMSLWHKRMKNYWRKHDPAQLTQIGELENRFDFDLNEFYRFSTKEVGFFVLNAHESEATGRIFAIKHRAEKQAEKFFFDLSVASDTAAYQEVYRDRTLRRLMIDQIPARIFGSLYRGFPASYFFIDSEFIYIGNSPYALKTLIDDIEEEDTWRKSAMTHEVLENTNEDANFSIYLKSQAFLDHVSGSINERWLPTFQAFREAFRPIPYVAMQFTDVDGKFYTNFTGSHPGEWTLPTPPVAAAAHDLPLLAQTTFSEPLVSKPFGVRNHNDRSLEMMVQDEKDTLHLVSAGGTPDLKISLAGRLKSKVFQLDYYKDGKLQYLFALDQSLHLVDRKGKYLPNYPIKWSAAVPISQLSLIDYNRSKNYRLFVADEKGNYYLLNRAGQALKGWDPQSIEGVPAAAGVHCRVLATDFMLMLQQNGRLYAFNRRGEPKPGFPVTLNGHTKNGFFIQKGSDLADSKIICLSDRGEKVAFNFRGATLSRQQLYRAAKETDFRLLKAHNEQTFLAAAIVSGQIHFFDSRLEPLFSVAQPSAQLLMQYYYFSQGNQLIIIIDQQYQKAFLYNQKGVLLSPSPLPTGHGVAVLYRRSQEDFKVYYTAGKQLNVVALKP